LVLLQFHFAVWEMRARFLPDSYNAIVPYLKKRNQDRAQLSRLTTRLTVSISESRKGGKCAVQINA